MKAGSGENADFSIQLIRNPYGVAFEKYRDFSDARRLLRDPVLLIAGVLMFLIQFVVLALSAVLWLSYGWWFVLADMFRQLVVHAFEQLVSSPNPLARIAIALPLVVYGCLLLVCVLACAPGWLFYLAGLLIATASKHPIETGRIVGYGILIAVVGLVIAGLISALVEAIKFIISLLGTILVIIVMLAVIAAFVKANE